MKLFPHFYFYFFLQQLCFWLLFFHRFSHSVGLWLRCYVFLCAVLRPRAEPGVPHKRPPLGGDSGDVLGGGLANLYPSHLLKIKGRKKFTVPLQVVQFLPLLLSLNKNKFVSTQIGKFSD